MSLLLLSNWLYKNRKAINIVDLIILFIVIAFSGSRYYTGTDYGNYYRIFNTNYIVINEINIFSLISPDEIGLYVINNIMKKLLPNSEYVMFWVTSALIYVPLYVFLKKKSGKFWISFLSFILLGHYTMSFNIIKQYIAATFVFIAFVEFYENKKKSTIVYILLAIIFHFSSIIYIPLLYVAKKIKPNFFTFSFFVFSGFLIEYIANYILINVNLLSVYNIFINSKGSKIGMILISSIWVLFGCLLLMKKKSLIQLSSNNYLYLNMFHLSLTFSIGAISNMYFARVTIPLQYSLFFLLPDYIECIKTRYKKILYLLLMIFLFIWFGFYISNYGGVIPYDTYLKYE
ncbi:MAG: EpsG family protein [Tissierellia bacterium]|nr:EpsG family protein [Tissierellia bacterium]